MHRRLLQIGAGITLGLSVALVTLIAMPKPLAEVAWAGAFPPSSPYPAPELSLSALDGDEVQLSDFRGVTTVVFFGFSHCPDVCPVMLHNLSGALDRLDAVGKQLRVLFVSVDPERDTEVRLREWLGAFHPGIVALRGTEEEIGDAAAAWGVHFQRWVSAPAQAHDHHQGHGHVDPDQTSEGSEEATAGYRVDHTGRAFVVDPSGDIILFLPPFLDVEAMTSDLLRVTR